MARYVLIWKVAIMNMIQALYHHRDGYWCYLCVLMVFTHFHGCFQYLPVCGQFLLLYWTYGPSI